MEPNRAYAEVSKTAHELQRVGPKIVDLKRVNNVAILYSVDSLHGIEYMKFSDKASYQSVLQQMYSTLYRLNIGVDFIFPETVDLKKYRVIVVPPLYVANDDMLSRLSEYVHNGGHLLATFKSGFCNEFSTVRWAMAPGPLRQAAGFRYQEFSNLGKPLPLKDDPFHVGEENRVSEWAEMLIPEGAQALAYYDHPFFNKYPAITRNRFGSGTLTYEGTILSNALQEKVLSDVLQIAGLTGPDQQLLQTVRVKHGVNRDGRTIHYYLNYSSAETTFVYPYRSGSDLLTERAISHSQSVRVKPWDLLIIEEQ